MPFGGTPSAPSPKPPPPMLIQPEVAKMKSDILERLKRSRSRAASQLTMPGLMSEAQVSRPNLLGNVLSTTLGGR